MVRPNQDAIQAFMSITGASQPNAMRKLEEYGGNLNDAVNAHFIELERQIMNPVSAVPSQHNHVDMNTQNQVVPWGISPFLSAARSFRPSLLLDPNYRRHLVNQLGVSAFTSHMPIFPHTGGFNRGNEQPQHLGPRPPIEDVYGTSSSHHPEIRANVSRDYESHDSHLYNNDIEEEMVPAAIEKSKREAGEDASDVDLLIRRQLHLDDEDLAQAISLSLKTAEQEKAMREQMVENRELQLGVDDLRGRAEKSNSGGWKLNPQSSSSQEGFEDAKEHPLVSNEHSHDGGDCPQLIRDALHSNEWGGISSKELDEAVMLEASLFGEIPKGSSQGFLHSPSQSGPEKGMCPNQKPIPRPLSPSFMTQRLLCEQQDDVHLASLLADKDKEINALMEADTSCLKEEVLCKKMLAGEESERWLAAKEASLPEEPAVDDEKSVTLLVRMPDGRRLGRRFLKSDKLRYLFDFIDVGRTVKPGTYKLVRPYPRRAFGVGDSSLSFNELGLTSKQEAMFLELI